MGGSGEKRGSQAKYQDEIFEERIIMRILIAGSQIQQMAGFIFALSRMGHEVGMYPKPIEELVGDEEQEQQLESFLKKAKVNFVLSNVFSKEVARATNRLNMKYAVWCMDSPAYPAWVSEADYDNCYLFYFDYREYELKKKGGQCNAYHLPLAVDVVTSGQLVITDEEIKKYGCDMSFVGGLYTKNLYDNVIEKFPVELQNAFTEVIEQSAFIWDGQNRRRISPELAGETLKLCPDVFDRSYVMPDEYWVQTFFLDQKLTQVERTLLMELLSQQYDIHLHTRAEEEVPEGVRRFPEIPTEEARKVFYSSKINLNITLRSIASGVPARVFEVMGVGGFVLTNWQEEIPELFVEDKEIVTYKTPEELIDKADYYLKHEDKRVRIGVNGYRKVKERYTYEHRLDKIISIIQGKE